MKTNYRLNYSLGLILITLGSFLSLQATTQEKRVNIFVTVNKAGRVDANSEFFFIEELSFSSLEKMCKKLKLGNDCRVEMIASKENGGKTPYQRYESGCIDSEAFSEANYVDEDGCSFSYTKEDLENSLDCLKEEVSPKENSFYLKALKDAEILKLSDDGKIISLSKDEYFNPAPAPSIPPKGKDKPKKKKNLVFVVPAVFVVVLGGVGILAFFISGQNKSDQENKKD